MGKVNRYSKKRHNQPPPAKSTAAEPSIASPSAKASDHPPNEHPAEPRPHEREAREHNLRPKWTPAERLMVGLTAGIALASIIYAFVSYHQWQETKNSVKAMESANRLTERSLIISESPYIHVTHIRLRPLTIGKPAIVDVQFKNLGRLSAEDFGAGAVVEIRKDPPTLLNTDGGKNLGEFPPGIPKSF
ncbi:MAG: hypothetical protein AAB225_25705, partial [Acidobacteriota bacterium]